MQCLFQLGLVTGTSMPGVFGCLTDFVSGTLSSRKSPGLGVCVCTCACTHLCAHICMHHVHTHIHAPPPPPPPHTHTHAYIHTCTQVTHTYTHVTHTHPCARAHTHMWGTSPPVLEWICQTPWGSNRRLLAQTWRQRCRCLQQISVACTIQNNALTHTHTHTHTHTRRKRI